MPRASTYRRRRANRLCVDCGAGLQETDGLRCVEDQEARDRMEATAHRRRQKLKARRLLRDQRVAANRCLDCPAAPAPGRVRCEAHLAERAAEVARYLDRKEARHARAA